MLTCDLVELGFWCEVAWIKLGDAELAAGKHTLQIRPLPTMKEEKQKQRGPDGKEVEVVVKTPEKILYVSDCLCLQRGQFRPNGRFKPGEDWQTAEDRKAAKTVFEIPQTPLYRRGTDAGVMAPGERIKTSLAGLWQVCRYDEQEVIGSRRTDRDAARRGRGPLDVDRGAGQQVRGQARVAVLPPFRLPHAGERARRAGRPLVRPAVSRR